MSLELKCIFDTRKSFYGKAIVRVDDNRLILKSYDTDVAYIENGVAVVNGEYSTTTMRHIKEFLKQNGFKAETTKQVLNAYGLKDKNQNLKKIILMLEKYCFLSVEDQQKSKADILPLFKKMWDLNPTEEEFSKATNGLVIFPEMLYYMVKRIKGDDLNG